MAIVQISLSMMFYGHVPICLRPGTNSISFIPWSLGNAYSFCIVVSCSSVSTSELYIKTVCLYVVH